MLARLISWAVFFRELKRQKPYTRSRWLRRWWFADEGALPIDECVNDDDSTSSQTDHNQRLADILYNTKRQWPQIFR
jgi:hypothetical protein